MPRWKQPLWSVARYPLPLPPMVAGTSTVCSLAAQTPATQASLSRRRQKTVGKRTKLWPMEAMNALELNPPRRSSTNGTRRPTRTTRSKWHSIPSCARQKSIAWVSGFFAQLKPFWCDPLFTLTSFTASMRKRRPPSQHWSPRVSAPCLCCWAELWADQRRGEDSAALVVPDAGFLGDRGRQDCFLVGARCGAHCLRLCSALASSCGIACRSRAFQLNRGVGSERIAWRCPCPERDIQFNLRPRACSLFG